MRLKGYAGWLLTEPTFLHDCRSLAQRWKDLPEADRPRFPLRRGSFHSDLPERTPHDRLRGRRRRSRADFFHYCDRWGLAGMASWDLPDPQGPLFPNLLPHGAPALPQRGLHLYLPIHYPLTGDDDLLARILQEQRCLADQLGLPRSAAGLPHHKAYATILEVLHWQRVIPDRFGPSSTSRDSSPHSRRRSPRRSTSRSIRSISGARPSPPAVEGRRSSVPALKVKN